MRGARQIFWTRALVCLSLRVISGSRGFSRERLGVVWFIPVRVGSLERALGWSGSLGFALVDTGSPRSRWFLSGSRGFTPRGRRVH